MTLRITIRILAIIISMMNYIISFTVILPTNLTNHKHDNGYSDLFNIIATTTATTDHNKTNKYYDTKYTLSQ